jgi:hypothetical protein
MAFIAFVIAMVVVQFLRARTYGPRVRWFPRRLRPRVNDLYRRHGWREPYDENLDRHDWWRD